MKAWLGGMGNRCVLLSDISNMSVSAICCQFISDFIIAALMLYVWLRKCSLSCKIFFFSVLQWFPSEWPLEIMILVHLGLFNNFVDFCSFIISYITNCASCNVMPCKWRLNIVMLKMNGWMFLSFVRRHTWKTFMTSVRRWEIQLQRSCLRHWR